MTGARVTLGSTSQPIGKGHWNRLDHNVTDKDTGTNPMHLPSQNREAFLRAREAGWYVVNAWQKWASGSTTSQHMSRFVRRQADWTATNDKKPTPSGGSDWTNNLHFFHMDVNDESWIEVLHSGSSSPDGKHIEEAEYSAVKVHADGGSLPICSIQFGDSEFQDIATSSWISLGSGMNPKFAVENSDLLNYHDPDSNPSRITIPSGQDGWYLVDCHISWVDAPGSADQIQSRFRVNGTTVHATADRVLTVGKQFQNNWALIKLTVGDYVEVQVWHNKGSDWKIDFAQFKAMKIP